MPGDLEPRWDVATAAQVARALEPLGIYWLEEPLRTDDVDGYAALRRLTSLRLAAGEMVRSAQEARDLVVRGGIDVLQCDVVLSLGIGGCRRAAGLADLMGRSWSPHTWSNGYGLLVNLHAALAFSTVPFVEVPFDPPAWSAERRDWLLPVPLEVAFDGIDRAAARPWVRRHPRPRCARALPGRLMGERAAALPEVMRGVVLTGHGGHRPPRLPRRSPASARRWRGRSHRGRCRRHQQHGHQHADRVVLPGTSQREPTRPAVKAWLPRPTVPGAVRRSRSR